MGTFELFLTFVIFCFIFIAGKVYFTLPLDASRYIRGFWSFSITFLIIYFIAIVTLFDFNRIVEPFLLYFSPNINMPVILLICSGLSSMVGILILMGADAHSEFSQRMIRCNFTSWLMVFILCHLYTLSYNYSIDRPIKTETLREVVGPERNAICENCKMFERITKTNYQWGFGSEKVESIYWVEPK